MVLSTKPKGAPPRCPSPGPEPTVPLKPAISSSQVASWDPCAGSVELIRSKANWRKTFYPRPFFTLEELPFSPGDASNGPRSARRNQSFRPPVSRSSFHPPGRQTTRAPELWGRETLAPRPPSPVSHSHVWRPPRLGAAPRRPRARRRANRRGYGYNAVFRRRRRRRELPFGTWRRRSRRHALGTLHPHTNPTDQGRDSAFGSWELLLPHSRGGNRG